MFVVRRLALAVLLSITALALQAQSIVTVAGGGSDDGHLATDVGLFGAFGLAVDAAGNIYIVEREANLVRRINKDGTITTIAGNGGAGFTGDGGRATKAALKHPTGIAIDTNGDIYIADHENERIRRIDAATGIISTFAGRATERSDGTIGDNGPATDAFLYGPGALLLDHGNLYVTEDDYNGNRIRKINLQSKIITTIAGSPKGDQGDSGDGGPATAALMWNPLSMVIDNGGNLFFVDGYNQKVRRIDTNGTITLYAGGGTKEGSAGDGGQATDASLSYPTTIALDNDGNLLILEINGLRRVDKTTHVITTITRSIYATGNGLLVLKNGDIIVAQDFTVDRIPAGQTQSEIFAGGGFYVGDGLPATAAVLRSPAGLALDRDGNLYIADEFNLVVRKVDAKSGIISTYAGNGDYYTDTDGLPATQMPMGVPMDVAFDPQGNLFVLDVGQSRVVRVDKATGIATFYAGGGAKGQNNEGVPAKGAYLNTPTGIAFDRAGNLFIADEFANKIWRVDATAKTIATFAGTGDAGYAGDGGAATAAKLDAPVAVAVDSAGNVYISDYFNNAVRKVNPSGTMSTIAGGNNNNDPPFGDGGPASAAYISPQHMNVDPRNDDLYIADDYSSRIRKIDAKSGIISTVAGSGTAYFIDADFTGDNGPAKDARLNFPFEKSGVFVDSSGDVYISDTSNNRVRAVFSCGSVAAPQLSAPANGTTNASTSPTLTWSPVVGAFRYDVRVDTVSPPARVIASDITETSFTPSLAAGANYFWSVTAKGDSFCASVSTAASAISTFTTAIGCGAGAFDLSSPADGASSPSQLSWQSAPGAGTYDLYLGSNTPPPLFESGLTATTHAVPNVPGRVYWFVVAHAACDATKTATTPIRSYNAAAGSLCGASPSVTPVNPANGASNVATSVTLTWSVSQVNAPVDVYFGTTTDPPLLRSGIPATQTSLALPALDPGVTYYWKVVAGCTPASSSAVASFTTQVACNAPQGTQILFAPQSVSAGATYSIVWSAAAGLDVDGGYLVERSTSASFSPVLDSQITSSTAASFVAGSTGAIYHRVRAIPACDPTKSGPLSDTKSVTITGATSNIIFTVQPAAVVTSLGESIEDRRGTFALENIGATPAQVIVGQSELPGSRPFFSIAEGGAFVTLQPRVPKTFTIQYSGPPNNTAASYQGVIFVTSVGGTSQLAVTPYAFVNLKVGGAPAAAPQFFVDGVQTDYAAFPGFAGADDSNRPGRDVAIKNPGSAPMDLAAEVGPDVWLVPESGWNSQPLAAGATRTFKLFTRRPFAPSGSPLPRYTYFTVRTKDGASSRMLVQDNDQLSVTSGRSSALDVSLRSFIVPDAPKRLRLTNNGGDSVQVELIFTPAGADGFDANSVKRTVIVVPPNDVVTLVDPVSALFGGTSGQIEVRIPRERLGLILVGASIPIVTRGEGARIAAPHVIYLPSAPGVATTITLAETSGFDKATVRLVSDNGQTFTQDIPRYGMKRVSVNSATRWEIDVDSGGGAAVGIATLGILTVQSRPLNDRTGATSLARAFWKIKPSANAPSVTTVVPVISGSTSAGNAPTYRTAIGLVAQSSAAQFLATFYPSTGSAAITRTVNVGIGQTAVYNDVMKDLFAVASPSDGNLFLQGPPNTKVYAVLQETTSGGTTSPASSLPLPTTLSEALTSATSSSQRPLYLDGLEQSTDATRGTRWMLLLNEVGGAAGLVNVRLYEAGNRTRPIAEKDLQVNSNQQLKLDTVFAALGLDAPDRRKDRTNVEIVVTATGGSARVAASAVSIDNSSGDTKVYALSPVIGSGNPNINFATPVVTNQPPPSGGRHRSVHH